MYSNEIKIKGTIRSWRDSKVNEEIVPNDLSMATFSAGNTKVKTKISDTITSWFSERIINIEGKKNISTITK